VSFREFDQLLRVEAFDRYEVVFGGVVVREFVKEVTTLSLEIGVALGHNLPLFSQFAEPPSALAPTGPLSLRSVRRARTHPLGTRSSTIFGRSSSRNGSNESLTRPCERIR